MSKLKVSAIHDPDNDNQALSIDSSGNVTFSGTVSGALPDAIDVNASAAADSLNIDASGRVGIGVTNPQRKLQVTGDSGGGGELLIATNGAFSGTDTATLGLRVFQNSNENQNAQCEIEAVGTSNYSAALTFKVASGGTDNNAATERMRIASDGIISAGDPTNGKGWSNTPENNIYKWRSRAALTDTQTHWDFKNPNGVVGTIKTVSSSTQFNTSSDYRLKENVVDMTGAIDRLKLLQPRTFNFIADSDTTVDGFLAHEVSDVVPIAVSGEKDAVQVWEEWETLPEGVSVGDNKTDSDGNTIPDYQGIDQSKLVPLLTGALQEAIAKIEALETRIETLENA